MNRIRGLYLFVSLLAFLGFTSPSFTSNALAKEKELVGAGATFPYPLYSKMFSEYYRVYKVKVNYQAIGSGGGIRQLRAKVVDFGASDAYLSDEELAKFPAPVLHIPITAGAVAISYNLPGNPSLRLTPEVLADIFLGKITRWDDPRIQQINLSTKLPPMKIIVVHRSDGSGTTFIFTDYLSKVSKEWAQRVGKGKAVKWPTGLGGKGNAGVAGLIKQLPGAIGYVELVYCLTNDMPFAAIKNKSGNFVLPSIESVTESANIELPDDMRVSLCDTSAPNGYPISGFTWILVYQDLSQGGLSEEKAQALADLLWWMTHEGQKYTKPLHFSPLSDTAKRKVEALLKKLTFKGKVLLQPESRP